MIYTTLEAMSLDAGCFQACLVSDAIILKPHQIGRNIRDVISLKLSSTFEGVCSRHGYILPGSIRLHSMSQGSLESANLNGDVRYDLRYHALVCNPAIGSVFVARVVNMTRFGFLLHSGASPAGGDSVTRLSSIVETVVSRQATYTDDSHPDLFVDLDTILIGDNVNIRVMGKKFQLNDRHIFVVGRIVNSSPDTALDSPPLIGDNNDQDLSVIAATEMSTDERDETIEQIQDHDRVEDEDGDGDGDGEAETEPDGGEEVEVDTYAERDKAVLTKTDKVVTKKKEKKKGGSSEQGNASNVDSDHGTDSATDSDTQTESHTESDPDSDVDSMVDSVSDPKSNSGVDDDLDDFVVRRAKKATLLPTNTKMKSLDSDDEL